MEAQQLSCCGIFELAEIGDNYYWTEGEETYNPTTGNYDIKHRTRPEALRACKDEILEALRDVTPTRRLVFATTVAGMSIAQEALRSLRFRVDRRFRNGNSGNMVTLWSKYVR